MFSVHYYLLIKLGASVFGTYELTAAMLSLCYLHLFWKFHAQVFISFLYTPFQTNSYIKPTKPNDYFMYAHVFKA